MPHTGVRPCIRGLASCLQGYMGLGFSSGHAGSFWREHHKGPACQGSFAMLGHRAVPGQGAACVDAALGARAAVGFSDAAGTCGPAPAMPGTLSQQTGLLAEQLGDAPWTHHP